MSREYFFDVPVYRLPREKYYADRQIYVDSVVYQTGTAGEPFFREQEKNDPSKYVGMRTRLEKSYGGCWEFNEVIGYIRLHFLGTQVRGEYFASTKKRVVRTRTRTLEWITWKLAPEVDVDPPYGKEEILRAVRQYISDCKRQLPRRHIDDEVFERIAPHVDWPAILSTWLR
ncbi:hypothetical protein LL974_08165 [Xanthomonas campestris pv. cannae]|nr:hypothetical protein [Xanthomonas campestris pv. cannae]